MDHFPEGSFVRDRRFGRRGRVRKVIPPRPDGRVHYVVWEGGLDFSLMSASELEAGEPFHSISFSNWLLENERRDP